ncbi:ABC transporter substrate-binding protein [Mesobacterium pallidum]|uniref:ABC transporter substrate-binding protein n=1 Tax=Mesobacterium pallidum TaxID=2872037 RepID=UPI001EE1A9CE|nr:ABC transporter substrate-binding protein [Mesobacterium pallidum]
MTFGFLKAAALATATALATVPAAWAAELEKVSYLFPAPDFLPAFTPFQVARAKGYYEEEGLDVSWAVGKGGADVAKQVAVGNADLGGGIGDTSIIVRPNGLPVKAVALLGGKALVQIVIREDSGAADIAGLKGHPVGVLAFQDTTFYNLLAALSSAGLTRDDVDVRAVGPAGMVQLMISGDLDAIAGTPDWAASIEDAGVPIKIIPINDLFPAMAQAILASDKMIETRPEVVKGFVTATLRGMEDVMTDPAGSAELLEGFLPQFEGKAAMLEDRMRRYTELVYATDEGQTMGAFEADRVQTVMDFYAEAGIISEKLPLDDVYTNAFVGAE